MGKRLLHQNKKVLLMRDALPNLKDPTLVDYWPLKTDFSNVLGQYPIVPVKYTGIGQGIVFNGVDDYLTLNSLASFFDTATTWTFTFSFYFEAAPVSSEIVLGGYSSVGGNRFYFKVLGGSGDLRILLGGSDQTITAMNPGWHTVTWIHQYR